jgi:hypothetical protein
VDWVHVSLVERKEDGSCEHVNGISGSMQRRKFIE